MSSIQRLAAYASATRLVGSEPSDNLTGAYPVRVHEQPVTGQWSREPGGGDFDPDTTPPIRTRKCRALLETTPGDIFGPYSCALETGHGGMHRTFVGSLPHSVRMREQDATWWAD